MVSLSCHPGRQRMVSPLFFRKKTDDLFSHRRLQWWPFLAVVTSHKSHLPTSFVKCCFKIEPHFLFYSGVTLLEGVTRGGPAAVPFVTPLINTKSRTAQLWVTGGRRVDWRLTSAAGLDVSSADQRRTATGLTSTEVQCREEIGRQWPPGLYKCNKACTQQIFYILLQCNVSGEIAVQNWRSLFQCRQLNESK